MRFSEWFRQFAEDVFPGTTDRIRTADITNTNMGVASRYQGPGETGEKAAIRQKEKVADFGQKSRSKKAQSAFWRNIHVTPETPDNYIPS